nr:hypothetical protein [Heyndrickxia oleronia]
MTNVSSTNESQFERLIRLLEEQLAHRINKTKNYQKNWINR